MIESESTPALNVPIEHFREMIGLRVKYRGMDCVIHEVLEDGPSLVLVNSSSDFSIQADQHGEAHRRVKSTYTVQILSPDALEFSSAFLSLEPLE